MSRRLKALFTKGQDQGFTLIELLIVVLIVGILAAVATPLYLGYVKDAKTAEGKAVAGSLWTAVQSNAIGTCGVNADVSAAYPKAGLPGGSTADGRWSVTGTPSHLKVDCTAGTYTPGNSVLFELDGVTSDINFVKIQMVYDTTGATTPPNQLKCQTDSSTGFVPC